MYQLFVNLPEFTHLAQFMNLGNNLRIFVWKIAQSKEQLLLSFDTLAQLAKYCIELNKTTCTKITFLLLMLSNLKWDCWKSIISWNLKNWTKNFLVPFVTLEYEYLKEKKAWLQLILSWFSFQAALNITYRPYFFLLKRVICQCK